MTLRPKPKQPVVDRALVRPPPPPKSIGDDLVGVSLNVENGSARLVIKADLPLEQAYAFINLYMEIKQSP